MKRLLTAAIAVPLSLLAVFKLPPLWFFVLCVLLIDWGALEFVRMVRPAAPNAPLGALLFLVPLAAAGLVLAPLDAARPEAMIGLVVAVAVLSVGLGTLVLLARTPVAEALPALGVLAYGVPYFALAIACLYWLQRHDPWVLFLLCAIVWLGDAAAYYVGKALGRHKLAPVVSPKKTWEGAAAGFVTGVVATIVWSICQYNRLDWRLLAAGAVTAVAAQVGDLVESMVKRGAGVKDSGGVLPGHGGMFDRMDAMLFAAPVLLLLLWLVGHEVPLR
jgi:phosphatidate cytidylyltransferase